MATSSTATTSPGELRRDGSGRGREPGVLPGSRYNRDVSAFEAETHGPEETAALAARLGRALGPGAVVLLYGELGAGKTTFVQGLARGMGLGDEARSPTFVLVHHYTAGPLPLVHADFYRLSGPEEALDLGLHEQAAAGVLVVEWPERAAGVLPDEALIVRLAPGGEPDDRVIRIEARGDAASAALRALVGARVERG